MCSGYNNTTGVNNIFIGCNAGCAVVTGFDNTVIGSVAGTAGMCSTVILAAGATERLRVESAGLCTVGNVQFAGNVITSTASNLRVSVNSANVISFTTANATITTGSFSWNFSSDGNLYLPGNISAGYRDIPQVTWTGTPTLAFSDAGKHYYTAAGSVTINIPANSSVPFPIGAAISLVNQSGANCTIARGTTTLYLSGNATGTTDRTLSHYGFATLVKVATDTWFLNGANVI